MMGRVFAYRYEVSHEWARRTTLRDLRQGKITLDDVCDADFLLRTASQYHGAKADRPCPICGAELREVKWVYGENLGRRANTARSAKEIDQLVAEAGPITVHFVEVCLECKWNHLRKAVTAVPVSDG